MYLDDSLRIRHHSLSRGARPKQTRPAEPVLAPFRSGGEIIRGVNEDPTLRKVAAEHLVRNAIHEDGSPLIHNGCEDQRAFDSTCREFYGLLTQPRR
jgi:hypothetical protein